MVYFISGVNFVPRFGYPKVYETFVWTPFFQIQAKTVARTRPACLLARQFPGNLLFGQAKLSMKDFQF